MCKGLQTTIKAVDILEKMGDFFLPSSLSWDYVGFLCTDGAHLCSVPSQVLQCW